MFNTMTHATFKHNGCYVTARRMVDTATGKFYGWHGQINKLVSMIQKLIFPKCNTNSQFGAS